MQMQLRMQIGIGYERVGEPDQYKAVVRLPYIIVYLPGDESEEEGDELLRAGILRDAVQRGVLLSGASPFDGERYAREVEAEFFGENAGEELADADR